MVMQSMEIEESEAPMYDKPMSPKYPYGLRLCLSEKILQKLAIEGVPAIDDKMMVCAVASVSSISSTANDDGSVNRYVELQITQLEVKPASAKEKDMAKSLYSGGAEDDEGV